MLMNIFLKIKEKIPQNKHKVLAMQNNNLK